LYSFTSPLAGEDYEIEVRGNKKYHPHPDLLPFREKGLVYIDKFTRAN